MSSSASADLGDIRVFMEITIGGVKQGRVVFLLYNKVVPRTAANFRALCTGEKGVSPLSGKPLHFKRSTFHRIIRGFMAQGGDFTAGNGTGGESIYGHKFADENFRIPHSKPFLLSMANAGPDTNGSQFFVTFRPTPFLNGKHVVFGEVEQGATIVQRMEGVETGKNDKPVLTDTVVITDCGIYTGGRGDAKEAKDKKKKSKKRRRDHSDSNSSSSSSSSSSDDSEKERKRRKKKEKKRLKKEKKRTKKEAKKAKKKSEEKERGRG